MNRRPARYPLFPARAIFRSEQFRPPWMRGEHAVNEPEVEREVERVPAERLDGGALERGFRNRLANRRELYVQALPHPDVRDRKSTRLNSSHANISYAVFCLE